MEAAPCGVSRPPSSSSSVTAGYSQKSKRSLRVRASAAASSQQTVTVLDYGAGNVRSVRNAIRHLGFHIKDVNKAEDIMSADRLVFPGVGAFGAAMEVLNQNGLGEALRTYIEKDKPFLGICLGLQLLFESSEENGPVKGLGVIPGTVGRFDSTKGLIVPHIGWNALQPVKDTGILQGIEGHHVYFVHSYRALPSDDNEDWISSLCNYGESFVSSVSRGNVNAVQFHPEKSGVVGLSILQNFLRQSSSSGVKTLVPGKASKLAKRVIACLDVRANDNGDLVVTKGDQYDVRETTGENEVRNLGKPVELASQYYRAGADEVSFLNITGFRDFPLGDLPMLEVLRCASENVFVPLTVGGGIRDFTDANGRYYSSLEVASEYFRSGADKISIGSDAVFAAEEYLSTGVKTGKTSIEQISRVYGNQAVVVSIDPRRVYIKSRDEVKFKSVRLTKPGPNGEEYAWYQCTVKGGREGRSIGAYELAKAVEQLGAGEILLNCIDCDGQGEGYDMELIKLVSDAVTIPVIASSGAGAVQHFSEVFQKTNASAALAAGIFHRNEVPIQSVKEHLLESGVEVRMLPKEQTTQFNQSEIGLRGAAVVTDKPGHVDSLVQVAHSVADIAGKVLRKYFRQRFDIIDKPDLSPVTIADREAEESMVSLILHNFPSHAIFGEENGWRCKDESADYVWVLDPIDGTKSFITGKPLFGTLISVLHKGKPIIGIIDQPILRERWVGIDGKKTTLNGREITTRTCSVLSQAYLYTTSPHLFSGEAEEAFVRVRNKVKVPLYGCDCYAYALLASGFVDIVVESGLKPYDFLALLPVIEGAGGIITDWKGDRLNWQASPQSHPTSYNVVAAGDAKVHKEAIEVLQWS